MAARNPRAARPVDVALQRLVALAGRGVAPGRMAREVDAILGEWRDTTPAGEEAELAEQIATLREHLAEGVAAAEEAVEDVDQSDAGAVKQARQVLAALVATRDAAQGAVRARP
jgi:hypothetical protein